MGLLNYVLLQAGSGHGSLGAVTIGFCEIVFPFGFCGEAKCVYFVNGAAWSYSFCGWLVLLCYYDIFRVLMLCHHLYKYLVSFKICYYK